MIAAIVDTNVLVQAVISSPLSASARVPNAYYDGEFRIVYSPDTFDELIEESSADFLVTNDRRHLLRLRRHRRTQIVTPAQFLRQVL